MKKRDTSKGQTGDVQRRESTDAAGGAKAGAGARMVGSLPYGASVQRKGGEDGAAQVRSTAAAGVSGSGGSMPHASAIQASFGSHDVSSVRAHTSDTAVQASKSIGAEAYAMGDNVAFAGSPTLHTAAHEAAHVVQQRAGVSLDGGVGRAGDSYERHADRVADLVVQGRSAESALGESSGGASVQRKAVQRYDDSPTSYTHDRQKFGDPKKDKSFLGMGYSSDAEKKRAAEVETEKIRKGEQSSMETGAATAKTKGWDSEILVLQTNTLAVYDTVLAAFKKQAAAYLEAYTNMKGVFDEVSKRMQTIATILGICFAVTGAVVGSLASGLMTSIAGRFTKLVGIAGTNATAGISEGLVELMKQTINLPAGAIKFTPTMPSKGSGFGDPGSFKANGEAIIWAERADFQNYVAWLSNNRAKLEGNFSPADVLKRMAPEWAAKKAGAASLRAGVSTKSIEKELWKSWITKNGKGIRFSCGAGVTTVLDVPKEVVEHLEDDLNISQSTMKDWAGVK